MRHANKQMQLAEGEWKITVSLQMESTRTMQQWKYGWGPRMGYLLITHSHVTQLFGGVAAYKGKLVSWLLRIFSRNKKKVAYYFILNCRSE